MRKMQLAKIREHARLVGDEGDRLGRALSHNLRDVVCRNRKAVLIRRALARHLILARALYLVALFDRDHAGQPELRVIYLDRDERETLGAGLVRSEERSR